MTEIKAKISDLKELCQLVSLVGKDTKGKTFLPIPEFVINASVDGVQVQAVNKGTQLAVELKYKKITVVQPGAIVIGDVEKFTGFLDRFNSSDDVTVSTTENRIIITRLNPKKIARIPMADSGTLETKGAQQFLEKFNKNVETGYYETSKTKFGVKVTLNAGDVKSVIDDGEAVNQRIYPWKLGDTGLTVKVGDAMLGEIETDIPLKKVVVDSAVAPVVESAYAYGIDNIFGNLSGEVVVSLANGIGSCPMIVEKKSDKFSLKIILAPVVVSG
jgi:hypothetical protein